MCPLRMRRGWTRRSLYDSKAKVYDEEKSTHEEVGMRIVACGLTAGAALLGPVPYPWPMHWSVQRVRTAKPRRRPR